jgi:hypothetical protein
MVTKKRGGFGGIKTWQMVLAGIVLFAGGYMFIYAPLAAHFDKQRFIRAEEELTDIMNLLADQTNPKEIEGPTRSCDYSSKKYSQGALYCNFTYQYTIQNVNAKEVFLLSEELSKNNPEIISYPQTNAKGSLLVQELLLEGILCKMQYSLDENEKTLVLKISCAGEAKAEHFSVE